MAQRIRLTWKTAPLALGACLMLLGIAACSDDDEDSGTPASDAVFTGGPDGGAFQEFAVGLAELVTGDPSSGDSVDPSDGSTQNLARVNAGDADYGLSFAGDVFLGREGRLQSDETVYDNVAPLAAIYGGTIHLVVHADSDIESVDDLAGKRIAPGADGSGAAQAAQRYFDHLGLWDELDVEHIGYADAASAILDGELDAFWVLSATPTDAVVEAADGMPIRLLDTYTPALESGFFDEFPFYTERTIPAGTYTGVDTPTSTFQDTAVWVASTDLDADAVEAALAAVFTEDGLAAMREVHPAANEMSIADALTGISVPLHPGAQQFWESEGLDIPEGIAAN